MEQVTAWIVAIAAGGSAAWLAREYKTIVPGDAMDFVVGAIGGLTMGAVLDVLKFSPGGWVGYTIACVIGACIAIQLHARHRQGTNRG